MPLTPGRSIAVDRLLHTFGTPFYIDAPTLTAFDGEPFRRLMIAQDTGSAITGPARGDLFAGSGDAAGEIAGVVRNAADFYALVPRALARGRIDERARRTALSEEDRVLWNLVARTAKPLKGTLAVEVPRPGRRGQSRRAAEPAAASPGQRRARRSRRRSMSRHTLRRADAGQTVEGPAADRRPRRPARA